MRPPLLPPSSLSSEQKELYDNRLLIDAVAAYRQSARRVFDFLKARTLTHILATRFVVSTSLKKSTACIIAARVGGASASALACAWVHMLRASLKL
jgi:hypothetical protein